MARHRSSLLQDRRFCGCLRRTIANLSSLPGAARLRSRTADQAFREPLTRPDLDAYVARRLASWPMGLGTARAENWGRIGRVCEPFGELSADRDRKE